MAVKSYYYTCYIINIFIKYVIKISSYGGLQYKYLNMTNNQSALNLVNHDILSQHTRIDINKITIQTIYYNSRSINKKSRLYCFYEEDRRLQGQVIFLLDFDAITRLEEIY